MTLQERIVLLSRLGGYMRSEEGDWVAAKEKAYRENAWFIPEFIEKAVRSIADRFLQPTLLQEWAAGYGVPDTQQNPKNVGIVMAGNIPLVGFHDLLCVFISGHRAVIKPSSKDEVLIRHLAAVLGSWDERVAGYIRFEERLSGCDAYIATGSNNSGRYFEYYFGKYPNIIRRNRTSVAVLNGTESPAQLAALGEDIMSYFGLGCRNITQLHVPRHYDFIPLLDSLRQYDYFLQFHKYKHNFDYHLALLIMGNRFYMSNDCVVLTENESPFSPVSQLHYAYYDSKESLDRSLTGNDNIQCITGSGYLPFGAAQSPSLTDYADGVDTMAFLARL